MHPRTREQLEALPPEKRAAAEAAIARSLARLSTPEGQAEEEEVIRKVREEFSPAADPELAGVMVAFRAERERAGLSLADLSARTGIDRATLSKLETGQASNPTIGTLRRYARALGKRLALGLADG